MFDLSDEIRVDASEIERKHGENFFEMQMNQHNNKLTVNEIVFKMFLEKKFFYRTFNELKQDASLYKCISFTNGLLASDRNKVFNYFPQTVRKQT